MAKFVLSADGCTRAQAAWRKRAQKLLAAQPKSFRGAMQAVHQADVLQLDRMVYSRPVPRKKRGVRRSIRTGLTRRSEKLRYQGATDAVIANDARSAYSRDVYPWYVALGHIVHKGPRSGIKKGVLNEEAGDHFVGGRNWRRAAIKAAQHFIPLAMKGATAEAMRD